MSSSSILLPLLPRGKSFAFTEYIYVIYLLADFLDNQFLNQESIPYCYSSCCGDPVQKSTRLHCFKSNRVKFVLQANAHQLTESNFDMNHTFSMASMTLFQAEKCCCLVSAHAVSARRLLHASTAYAAASVNCPLAILSTVAVRTCLALCYITTLFLI